jgi:hypothetical protein
MHNHWLTFLLCFSYEHFYYDSVNHQQGNGAKNCVDRKPHKTHVIQHLRTEYVLYLMIQ